MDRRNAELKEVGARIKALRGDAHGTINAFSCELGSAFGMEWYNAYVTSHYVPPQSIHLNLNPNCCRSPQVPCTSSFCAALTYDPVPRCSSSKHS